jgi:hypothetical protein
LKATADKFFNAYQWDSAAHYYNLAAKEFLNAQEIRQYLYCKNQEAFALGIHYNIKEALEITYQALREYSDSLKAAQYDVYFFWKASGFR